MPFRFFQGIVNYPLEANTQIYASYSSAPQFFLPYFTSAPVPAHVNNIWLFSATTADIPSESSLVPAPARTGVY